MYYYFSKLLAPFLNITNILIILILLSFIFQKLLFIKNIKLLRIILVLFFLLLSFIPIGNLGLAYLEKDFFNQSKISKIDNIIVLAGSENINQTKKTGKLNLNGSSERLIASVKLGNQYLDSKIYFLGGDGNLVKNSIDEANVAKIFYNDVGFETKRVKFINNTRNTVENLEAFKFFNNDDQINVIITSAFHMKRALLVAKKLDIKLIPYPVDFKSDEESSIINYYQKFSVSGNLQNFDIFFREILGIFAFKLFK